MYLKTFFRNSIFLTFLAFLLTGCIFSTGQSNSDTTESSKTYYTDSFYPEMKDSKKTAQKKNPIRYFEFPDRSTGLVSNRTPYPSNWKKSKQAGFSFEGPNGIKISNPQLLKFQYTQNQEMAWMMQQQGQQNTPPMHIDQIIEQIFMPVARQTNRTLTKTYELPKIAEKNLNFLNVLFVSVPTQREVKSYGLEWEDDQGLSYLSLLSVNQSYTQYATDWNISTEYIVAQNKDFQQAKADFLYGKLNNEINPQWLYAVNSRDAQRAGMSYQAHRARMDAITVRGNTTKSVGDIYSEISDITHNGYLKRSNMTNHGQRKTVNMIGERTVIANHNTGEHYNVPDGSKYYWVGNDGSYFGTDNANYDPRTNQQINNVDWTRFEKEN